MDLAPTDLVKAHNPSDSTVDVVGVKFPPHSMKVVTFAWMMNHYGDPRSIRDNYQVVRLPNGQTTGVAPRQVEVQRVTRMWNIGVGPGMRAWGDIPVLKFSTMEDESIQTAFDDPAGDSATSATTSIRDQAQQDERIRTLQKQVEQLLQISGLDHDAIPVDEADLPSDESEASTETTSPWAGAESVTIPTDSEAIDAFGA